MSSQERGFEGSIAFLDSGIGGLSIFNRVRARLPAYQHVYYLDRRNFPYGKKNEEEVIRFCADAFHWLGDNFRPDLFVVACNTASTIALPYLREHFKEPIVGVVPSIKPAAQMSQSGTIGVLATSGTLQRSYLSNLIRSYGLNKNFILGAADELVAVSEEYVLTADAKVLSLIPSILSRCFNKDQLRFMDTMVLGCTHFSHVISELEHALPSINLWLDSTEAVSNRVCYLLNLRDAQSADKEKVEKTHRHTLVLSAPLSQDEEERLKDLYPDFLIMYRGIA